MAEITDRQVIEEFVRVLKALGFRREDAIAAQAWLSQIGKPISTPPERRTRFHRSA
jgi:hypothetical protein